MTARQHVEHVLLGLGVGAELLSCLGVLAMRDAFDRLHYAMAGTTLGPIFIAAAIVVHESFKQNGINALFVAGVLFLLGPVLANATARAARARRLGQVSPLPAEIEAAE